MRIANFLILLVFSGCSLEESQNKRTRQQNAVKEEIMRKEGEILYALPPLQPGATPTYFWEEKPPKT